MAYEGGYVGWYEEVVVVIRSFVRFDQLVEEALRKTNVEAEHRHSGIVRRFDLRDAIVSLSGKPVSACQASRRTAAEKNRHNTDESDQQREKCAVVAKAVGTAPHNTDHSTCIVSHCIVRTAKRYDMWTDLVFGRLLGAERFREHTIDLFGDIDGKVVLDVGCDTGRNPNWALRQRSDDWVWVVGNPSRESV